MDLPRETEDYIKETVDDALGLTVSTQTLQLKLRACEDAHGRLLDRYRLLAEKMRFKDQLIERAKAEASMNAVAVKKFVEENQRLAAECASLVSQCNKWEKECSLYDRDREALMDFGNEADERAKEAEFKVAELEKMLGKVYEELEFYRQEYEAQEDSSSSRSTDMEQNLVDSVLSTVVSEDEVEFGRAFLEASSGNESCQKLRKMWKSLRPSAHRTVTLVAKLKALQNDKEHLRINLTRAEEEVKLLFDEINILDAENKKLLKRQHREQKLDGSGGKHTSSASSKGNKRKSSPKMSSPVEMKFDMKDVDCLRQPLSPLRENSPECRMHKK